MQLLNDVDPCHVDPVLWVMLGAFGERHRAATGTELVLTSLRRFFDGRPSGHTPDKGLTVRAADVRRWYLDAKKITIPFCRTFQRAYSDTVTVIVEPEDLTPQEIEARGGIAAIIPHIHIQLKVREWPPQL